MVRYTVDLSQPGASAEALNKACLDPGNEIKVVVGEPHQAPHRDQKTFFIEKALLECVPYFKHKFSFEAAQAIPADAGKKRKRTPVLDPTSTLPEILPYAFECFFVPWLSGGLRHIEKSEFNAVGWAHIYLMLDYFQLQEAAEQAAQQMSNKVAGCFFYLRADSDKKSQWWAEVTSHAYCLLIDLPVRYIIVHHFHMAAEYGGPHSAAELIETLGESNRAKFALDILRWQAVLPTRRLLESRAAGGHLSQIEPYVWRRNSEDTMVCPADEVLMPLLFSSAQLPTSYVAAEQSFAKDGEDVRDAVRRFLEI